MSWHGAPGYISFVKLCNVNLVVTRYQLSVVVVHQRQDRSQKLAILRGQKVIVPVSGTSVGRIILLICSIDWRSGESPTKCINMYNSPIFQVKNTKVKSTDNFVLDSWRVTSVATENLFIDNSCNGEAIEAISERFPQLDVESSFTYKSKLTHIWHSWTDRLKQTLTAETRRFNSRNWIWMGQERTRKCHDISTWTHFCLLETLTFIVEPIDAIYAGTLMIPSQQEEVFWIFDFVR